MNTETTQTRVSGTLDPIVSFPFIKIAYENDELFSVWGPCAGDGKMPCDCPQCRHADAIAAKGRDWEDEYQKAKANNCISETNSQQMRIKCIKS